MAIAEDGYSLTPVLSTDVIRVQLGSRGYYLRVSIHKGHCFSAVGFHTIYEIYSLQPRKRVEQCFSRVELTRCVEKLMKS